MSLYSKKYNAPSLTLLCCLALSACGSGSPSRLSAVPTPTTTLPPPPVSTKTPAEFETSEYNADWSLSSIKASEAYARGFTGEGALIGLVDFGFELENPEINWHSLSQGANQHWVNVYEAYLGITVTESHHGHWVSSIAAGKKNDLATQGVAFDAQVLAVDFFAGVARHTETSGGVTYHVSDPWGYVVNNGARVVNKSIGYDEEDFISNPPATNGNQHYRTTNAARVVELGGLLIAAAGNDGDPDPMVSNIDTLNLINQNNLWAGGGFFLVAGSLNQNGTISSFSDRAGVLQNYYLVAPGEDVAVSSAEFSNSGYEVWNGTSFAAPHVVGAAALLFGQWPQLSAAEVAEILLDTATDLGDPGVDSTYGHGLLNLDAATKPSGQTTVAVQENATPITLEGSSVIMGAAFGDARLDNLSAVMILDEYERDFYVDASANIISAPTDLNFNSILDQRRSRNGGQWQLTPGLNASLSLDDRAQTFARPEIFLTPQERLDHQQHLQAWFVSGALSSTTHWVLGQGYGLDQVLDMMVAPEGSQVRPSSGLFLSDTPQHMNSVANDLFFASNMPLNQTSTLSFAVMAGKDKGQAQHNITAYQQDVYHYGLETRLSHFFDGGGIGLGFGIRMEQDTILGSRSSNGLKLAEQTMTGTLSLTGHMELGEILGQPWHFQGHATGGLSHVTAATASLFEDFNRFTSSQWQASFTTGNVIFDGDQFGFTLSQPLRVENARVRLTTATEYNLSLNAPDFTTEWANLGPTGREIALEGGYGRRTGSWTFSANIIKRFNAGHRAGLQDESVLFHVRTQF